MNKIINLNIKNGNLSIEGNIIAGLQIKIDAVRPFALEIGAEERQYSISKKRSLACIKCVFLDLPFLTSIGFNENNICDDVVLFWLDGSSHNLGYNASHEDVTKEKKFLTNHFATYFGRKSDLNKKSESTWNFSWGNVIVSQNAIHSNDCRTYIEYNT